MSGKNNRYFQNAIVQSAPISIPVKPLDIAIQQGRQLAELLNCTSTSASERTACLRSKSAGEIGDVSTDFSLSQFNDSSVRAFMAWVPYIDGNDVTGDIIEGIKDGFETDKRVVIGQTTEEGRLFVRLLFEFPVPSLTFEFIVKLVLGDVPDEVFALYPPANKLDTRNELEQMATDFMFTCSSRYAASKLSENTNIYWYEFNQSLSTFTVFEDLNDDFCQNKSCHGSDLPFTFQSTTAPPYDLTEDEIKVSDKMISYWTSFARFGNPNRGDVKEAEWLRFKPKGRNKRASLTITSPDYFTKFNFRQEYCDAWDTFGYN